MRRPLHPGPSVRKGMHSESTRSWWAICHQEHDIRHAHTSEECVALLGEGLLPEGEAFPITAPHCSLSC
jgi:hypothetical protein